MLEALGIAVALLAPIYALLWRIQRTLGCVKATLEAHDRRIQNNAEDIEHNARVDRRYSDG